MCLWSPLNFIVIKYIILHISLKYFCANFTFSVFLKVFNIFYGHPQSFQLKLQLSQLFRYSIYDLPNVLYRFVY